DTKPAITFDNLHKSYGELEVIKGISGEIYPGDVVSIIGPSGCGKSTFLRCMNHLETVTAGKLAVLGIDVAQPKMPAKALRRLRTQVGMVFQSFNLFPHLSVLNNLTIAPRKVLGKSQAEAEQTAKHYLEKVGLAQKANAYPDQLSGGQKQRVAIARSLCMNPMIILFDEPTSALDPELVGEVLTTMQQLAQEGMTMVVVTHEIQFAREVANKVIFLSGGYLEETGPAKEVLTNPQSDRLRTFLSRLK
ncbi:MAG: amino acid ABC transporter ATP-binding protein, partial [Cyanobacteria bacterium P01_H01_bin.121]